MKSSRNYTEIYKYIKSSRNYTEIYKYIKSSRNYTEIYKYNTEFHYSTLEAAEKWS